MYKETQDPKGSFLWDFRRIRPKNLKTKGGTIPDPHHTVLLLLGFLNLPLRVFCRSNYKVLSW